jgi:hypothetical protein
MQKVTLQFRDLDSLWSFTKSAKVQDFRVNTKKKQLTCTYEELIITEALVYFNVKVINTKTNKP